MTLTTKKPALCTPGDAEKGGYSACTHIRTTGMSYLWYPLHPRGFKPFMVQDLLKRR